MEDKTNMKAKIKVKLEKFDPGQDVEKEDPKEVIEEEYEERVI